MISRRKTREYLLQLLYARAGIGSSFDRDIFFGAFFEENDGVSFDENYLVSMQEIIMTHE
jgi:hypothetical protein